MIVLDVVLIPPLSATGAAIASSAGLVCGGALALGLFQRHAGFPVRELVLPRREDLALLRALARPFRRAPAQPSSARRSAPATGASGRRISSR